MGTSNFYNKNARNTFAVLMSYEDEETGENRQCEEFDYTDLLDNLRDVLEPLGYIKEDTWEDGLRSYDGKIFASKIIHYKGKIDARIEIQAIIRNGYYDGCNLDWEVKFHLEGNEYDEPFFTDTMKEDICYYNDYSVGMAKIQAKNIIKFFDRTKETLVAELETVFTEWSTPLHVVARFSNGETIYEKG